MFGIVQKDQMGLDKAIEETKYRMSRYSVTPNMLYAAALAVARGCAISCWL